MKKKVMDHQRKKKMMEAITRFIPITKRAIFLVLIFFSITTEAQRTDSVQSFSRKRFTTVVIGSAAAYTGAMVALSSAWYSKNDRQSFHFFNDANEWKQM